MKYCGCLQQWESYGPELLPDARRQIRAFPPSRDPIEAFEDEDGRQGDPSVERRRFCETSVRKRNP